MNSLIMLFCLETTMATNKVVVESQKPESTEADPKMKVIQVNIVQAPATPATVKVVPSGPLLKPTSSLPLQAGQTSSAPVVVVAKMAAPASGSQQVTKTTPGLQVTPSPTPGRTVVITMPRATAAASQPVTVAPRVSQTASPQLPANIHIPAGMMLIRSDSGQLMLVSQQALAQAQQAPRATSGPPTPRILTPPPTPSPSTKPNDKVTVIRMTAPPNFQSPVPKTALVKVLSLWKN